MVSTHRLFVEGGGDRSDLRTECRKGFRRLLERAGLAGRMPRIVACGGRRAAYEQFVHALANRDPGEALYLLVDSEGPVTHSDPWKHVAARKGDQWSMPTDAHEEDLHLMVPVMEAWFLADRDALQRCFGKELRASALPHREDVENVAKDDVFRMLHAATKDTKTGPYGKGDHSFRILGELDPEKLARASTWARRLLTTLAARHARDLPTKFP